MPRGRPPRTARSGRRARSDPFQLLVAEHDRLRAQLRRSLRGDGEIDTVVAAVHRHIEREAQALYPLCERLFGGREGAVAVMRRDHQVLEEELREIAAAGRSGVALSDRVGGFTRRLEDHLSREERVLFPLMDALLTGTDTARLAERLSVPARR